MEPMKFLLIFLALSAKTCSGGIVVQKLRVAELNFFVEATEKIVTTCYKNGGHAVVFAGTTSDTLIRSVAKHTIPVSLIDETLKMRWRHIILDPTLRYSLQTFVITVSSHTNLIDTFEALKRSIWWNHKAHFLILYSPLMPDKNCFFIPTLLVICYIHGVINAKVMCLYDGVTPIIANYNPYTDHAPDNWPLVRRHKHPYTRENFVSFWRHYNNEDICIELDWEKTKNLGGFKIPIMIVAQTKTTATEKGVNIQKQSQKTRNIIHNILRGLNASSRYWYQPVKPDGHGLKGMTSIDFNLHTALLRPTTYPYGTSGAVIMTQFRGHLTQIGKIKIVIDSDSRWGVLVVVLVTLMFFKFFMGQSVVIAALNVFRIACGSSLTRIPNNLSTRVYLTCVFFFYVTVQSFYTGQLASMLTNKVPLRNVDTMKDLMDLGHKIYAYPAYARSELAVDEKFWTRFIPINKSDCAEYVVRDPMAACLNNIEVLLDQATTLKMHLTTDLVLSYYVVNRIQLDWILEDKVNKILSWQFEADIIRPVHLRRQGQTLNDFRYDEEVKNNKRIKVMNLNELAFAFVILGIGLSSATICFISELVIKRIQSKTTDVKIVSIK